jgi:hypothetical protein
MLTAIPSGRPAFDCRGSIIISFSEPDRSITIKYQHTPLHKTVGELLARLEPPLAMKGRSETAVSHKTVKSLMRSKRATAQNRQLRDDGWTSARKTKRRVELLGGRQTRSKEKRPRRGTGLNNGSLSQADSYKIPTEVMETSDGSSTSQRRAYYTRSAATRSGMNQATRYPERLVKPRPRLLFREIHAKPR